MVKKLEALAGGTTDRQLVASIMDSANQIWLAGLGAFAKGQQEGGKIFDALVKEGEAAQERARKAANEKISAVGDKASGAWDKLEQVFEGRVAQALGRLGVPTRKDIDKLSRRVAELTSVVDKLSAATEPSGGPDGGEKVVGEAHRVEHS